MDNRKWLTMDGNEAAAHASYAFTEVATIYPITPSSVMPEHVDEWATAGRKNIFGQEVQVTEMQSEAGAAGAFHGSMLCESSVQEVMDLAPVAHMAAIEGRLPFINFFDGFRTSHEIQKIRTWDYADLDEMVNHEAIQAFRDNALNPNNPREMGSAQNPDIFFQAREACNPAYNAMPDIVQKYMDKVNAKIGTDYKLFNYYGDPEAESVIIAMGSANETIEETIDYLRAKTGAKIGVVKVRLYRPFSNKALLEAIPKTVKVINVLDRTKEPGAGGEPLYLDVCAALYGTEFANVPVHCGRFGLGSKDTNPAVIKAVFDNYDKKFFTVGIVDDVTNLSLPVGEQFVATPEGTVNCKFWGLGADGTVGANKNSIKIIGNNTDMYAQAYFDYDSKKSGGVTMSHLRFGQKPIKSTYLIRKADFVACHNPAYVRKFNMAQEIVDGGTFLLNCAWSDEELSEKLPGQMKKFIATHGIKFYTIDGVKIGIAVGMGPTRINTILQSAFFKLANIIPEEKAIQLMKDAAQKTYGRKGQDIVEKNWAAIEEGAKQVHEVVIPESWKDAEDEGLDYKVVTEGKKNVIDFVNNIQTYVSSQEGNSLPVSAFLPYDDGNTPSGTSAYEKRGIAVNIPQWDPSKCIQCARCSYVCPHAVIRTFALTDEEVAAAPEGLQVLPLTGMKDYKFTIGISAYDCTGCGSCANVCPGMKGVKALNMVNMAANADAAQPYFDYLVKTPVKDDVVAKFKEATVKGSQFKQPLLEFSGACAGCGETPYAKLITQLFGDRMYIANATGCSSIWGNSSPSTPYTTNAAGQGPAWANSLFEDNAEFGYGMFLAQKAIREGLKAKIEKIAEGDGAAKAAAQAWLDTYSKGAENGTATKALVAALEGCDCDCAKDILSMKNFLAKKSQWIFGGDGWAYDIGYGGVDHVLASGRDVNVMVFDTEVYSNTGGQASKATRTGAVAQFAAAGKETKKKDLAGMAMTYGYVYVAHICIGADYNQAVKAIAEAEAYDGPSLIVAYAPCINHGIRKGMGKSITEEELAVKAGYWFNFRYNPDLVKAGKDAFSLDSKAPTESYQDFIAGEVRYSSLRSANPANAQALLERSEAECKERFEYLQKLVEVYRAK